MRRTYGLEITDLGFKPHQPSIQTIGNFPMDFRQMNFCLCQRWRCAGQPQYKLSWASDSAHCQSSRIGTKLENNLSDRIKCLLDKKKSPSLQCFTEQASPRDLLTEQHLSSTGTSVVHKKVGLKLAGNANAVKWGNEDGEKHWRSCIRNSTAPFLLQCPVKAGHPQVPAKGCWACSQGNPERQQRLLSILSTHTFPLQLCPSQVLWGQILMLNFLRWAKK